MKINFIWDSTVSGAPVGFESALQTAANIIDSKIINPITVNIQVGWGEVNGTAISSSAILGAGQALNGVVSSYSQLIGALTASANSSNGGYIVANLPRTNSGGIWEVCQSLANALNIYNPHAGALDGVIGFSSIVNWCFDTTNGMGSNQEDFVATAIHEITHALGRFNFPAPGWYDSLSLYTYASKGNLQLTNNSAANYFSIDGGATQLNNFDVSLGGDSADWTSTVRADSFGYGQSGVVRAFTFTDLRVMEAIGYQIAPTYQITGTASVNEGNHDILNVQTIGVAVGTIVNYSMTGISSTRLMSGTLTGTLTIGSDGTGNIDLGIRANNHTDGLTTATVIIGNNLASISVNVNDTSLSIPPNIINLTTPQATVNTTAANDIISGGAGLYTVVYSGNLANYVISQTSTGLIVTDTTGYDGTDTLTNIERLKFNDISIAYDSSGNAGDVVKILGSVFGVNYISNRQYIGIGLSLMDGGMSYSDLAALALNAVGATTNETIVSTLWTNVVGTAPTAADMAPFLQMLNSGEKVGDLGVFAADTALNATNIKLIGLASGIEYV